MEYNDILLAVLTLGVVAMAIVSAKLVQVLSRFGSLAERMELLGPELERLSQETQSTLQSLQRLTDRAHDVIDDAQTLTGEAREGLVPVIRRISSTGNVAAEGVAHVAALVAATKAGWRAFNENGR